jgi:hypothetical protein
MWFVIIQCFFLPITVSLVTPLSDCQIQLDVLISEHWAVPDNTSSLYHQIVITYNVDHYDLCFLRRKYLTYYHINQSSNFTPLTKETTESKVLDWDMYNNEI